MKALLLEKLNEPLESVGRFALIGARTVSGAVWFPYRIKNIVLQVKKIGVDTLPIVTLMAIFTGMVLAVQTYYQFRQVGMEIFIGALVGLSMARELGPILTSIIVAGRVGSAIAAEIGSMKVTEQVDALKTLAVDPYKYLGVPRLLACFFMVPVLTVYAVFIGITGGFMISVFKYGLQGSEYMDKMIMFVRPIDIMSGITKSFFFGLIIALIGCYKGFNTEGGAEGVGRSTTSSVVTSSILILVLDFFLSLVLF